ncbi:MAG TPA: glycosyltransferase N-terminal domain-containing protein [Candidatus Cloacimonadota bacterium]|nr:glycosyltransferase N-terminal domain-containing protein [Candidatus Cloacimonadota bacterium]
MKSILGLLFTLYNLVLEAVFGLAYPLVYLVLRWYRYTEALSADTETQAGAILIHAASVGEVNAIRSLVQALIADGHTVVINTVTVAGREQARKSFPDLPVRLAVVDVWHLRKRYLGSLKPRLLLIVETEIWPNMLYAAASLGIPIVFINARLSEQTLRRYMRYKALLGIIAASVKRVIAQSEEDKNRFRKLLGNIVSNGGNLKYALSYPDYEPESLRRQYGFKPDSVVICFGSSRPGEEELILNSFRELKKIHPQLRLILAPRHLKRLPEVEALLKGMSYRRYTDPGATEKDDEIILMDVMGHLTEAYASCDLAIVGGSFYDFGGHNPLEPAYYQKPIIMGEYYSSCRDSVDRLCARKAIKICKAGELTACIRTLLDNPEPEMGMRAKLVLTENATALENHIRGIQTWL